MTTIAIIIALTITLYTMYSYISNARSYDRYDKELQANLRVYEINKSQLNRRHYSGIYHSTEEKIPTQ